jgi:hypothetical protein
MKPHAIYSDFIQHQDGFANLYLDMSIRFCDQMELSWFWVEMAMEEKQRAGLLHYCLENKMFAEDLPDPRSIQKLEAQLKVWTERASDPLLSVDDAFHIAAQIETSELRRILPGLTMQIQGPDRVIQKRQEVCSNHGMRLRNAADRFGLSSEVRSTLAQL